MPGRQVGTVGKIQALPGAPNVIPGKVVLSLEIRDLDAAKIRMLYDKIHAEAEQIAKDSSTKFDFKEINVQHAGANEPSSCAGHHGSRARARSRHKAMPRGAGHDAQEMARLGPVGMIFVPSVGGISHSPREYSRPEDIVNGANVLLNAVIRFDPDQQPI